MTMSRPTEVISSNGLAGAIIRYPVDVLIGAAAGLFLTLVAPSWAALIIQAGGTALRDAMGW